MMDESLTIVYQGPITGHGEVTIVEDVKSKRTYTWPALTAWRDRVPGRESTDPANHGDPRNPLPGQLSLF